ncbi:aminoglycoside phosphotransferase family protein [Nocardioides sp. CFH 31398]|uniref:aminoglycoside phosphotransferase family protein n=1 Tax=Nocardioides sp. CFH 31398 TaxID=2919579 RepID=UPI001F0710A9|nr:aminoglycoside phosphotransferase family protein [Nocardioides sp. CFH 31398]MCH1867684.1 aminoglycoside phosphotransferase family protein [Nocardioides sp. CFH 31398]
MSVPRLQPLVRARLAGLGAAGEEWTAALPDLLADLAAAWGLELGRGLPGGSASYVVRATTRDGEDVVVKVGLPGETAAIAREAAVLGAADGRGYARLVAHDDVRSALLVEALGESVERSMLSPPRTLDALAAALLEAWTLDLGEPRSGASRADDLASLVQELAGKHPGACDDAVLDAALATASRLAATDDPAARVWAHGDPHPANALRRGGAERGEWVLVDPDGLWADPAYDAGIAVREWLGRVERSDRPRQLIASYAGRLAAATGLDAERIAAWGYLERVSTGLYVLDFGAEVMGRRFLDSARLLLQ